MTPRNYYFRDYSYADNGFIPALLILELMSKKNMSLRQLLQPLRERYFISGEINTKLASMSEVPAKLAAIEARYKDAQIGRLDGISVDYPDWHFNVRASNTEPLLRLNLEAATPAEMERRRDEVLAINSRLEAQKRRRGPAMARHWRRSARQLRDIRCSPRRG